MSLLALEKLYADVVARFAADAAAEDPPATPAAQPFGWRAPAQRYEQMPRIAWVPGDDSSGDLGTVEPARNPGRNPRPLATLGELVTVYVEAVDRTDLENELAQYRAARRLLDAWLRAVYLAARGTYSIRSARWMHERKERRYGATIRVLLVLEAMVPDAPVATVETGARAVIVPELDDTADDGLDETAPAPPSVMAATTATVALTGEQIVDSVILLEGNRVLVKNQADPAENGIYVVATGAWSRTLDALERGFFVHVVAGSVNGEAGFELTTPAPIVVGTTALAFERVSP